MLVASNNNQDDNIAWLTNKNQGPFLCPSCNSEVILKKGKIRQHHFAHKSPEDCTYGKGESQQHLFVKRQIYEALTKHPNCSKCKMERVLKRVRPDISLYINDTRVAIEIQRSDISIDLIRQRTKRYTELDIYLLWILPDNSPSTFFHQGEEINVHRMKKWEEYLYIMYEECIYYWQKNAFVTLYDFDILKTWVEESDWGGGYFNETKTLKIPSRMTDEIHIANDFQASIYNQKNTKNYTIPSAKLWTFE